MLALWQGAGLILLLSALVDCQEFSEETMEKYRERVRSMFYHAYNGYLDYAYPYDELKPITCQGMDTWGGFSLTLVDALDTLVVLGNASEFRRAVALVEKNINVDANVNVSVFETNIRVIGGLLSAHMLSGMAGMSLEDGWPCSGPLLRIAERLAGKLLPAFNTYTGMPYGTVNLRYGVHRQETPVTCTAAVGTYILEFGSLTRLTGNRHFERVAMKALEELWKSRSGIGLVGNHIDVQSGQWTATDAGIGAGVDSYFEYLVKGSILLNRPELMRQFKEYKKAIEEHIQQDDWFLWVSMTKGHVTMPIFQSLEQFWPGVLTLTGDVNGAMRIMMNYHQVLKQYGFSPEFFNVPNLDAVHKRSGYPLRPELIESLVYLYQATRDPLILDIGMEIVEAIDHSAKTSCGYATIENVKDHTIEDRMESFFLAETTKYLYMLFDPDNFIHNPGLHGRVVQTTNGPCVIETGGYIFNTEAHPFDPSILYCCSKERQQDAEALHSFRQNLDLVAMLGLDARSSDSEFLFDPSTNFDDLFTRAEKAAFTKEERSDEDEDDDLVDQDDVDDDDNDDEELLDNDDLADTHPDRERESNADNSSADSRFASNHPEAVENDAKENDEGILPKRSFDEKKKEGAENVDKDDASEERPKPRKDKYRSSRLIRKPRRTLLRPSKSDQKIVSNPQDEKTKASNRKIALEDLMSTLDTVENDLSSALKVALNSLLDDTKKLLDTTAQLEAVEKELSCDDAELCSPGSTCRVIDIADSSSSPIFAAFLRMMYGSRQDRSRIQAPFLTCAISEGPRVTDNYKNIPPKTDNLSRFDPLTEKEPMRFIDPKLFTCKDIGQFLFDIRSCEVQPFHLRILTGGQVGRVNH